MSTYFQAAERCGLRWNVEEAKRAARRTVVTSSPSVLLDETSVSAAAEAAHVAGTGARKPPSDLVVLDRVLLPHESDRMAHRGELQASEADLAEREGKDLREFEQLRKVEQQRREELRRLWEAELQAHAQENHERALREDRVRQTQQQTRERLRATYGHSFLWDEQAMQRKRMHRREEVECEVEKSLSNCPWISEGVVL